MKKYMEKPEGFTVGDQEPKVYKLVKSLYSLKHALKQWHEKLDSVMIKDEFTINECNKCVYTKTVENAYIIICFYVDDILIIGTNIEVIKSTKRCYPKTLI